jgi:hypothetical protein
MQEVPISRRVRTPSLPCNLITRGGTSLQELLTVVSTSSGEDASGEVDRLILLNRNETFAIISYYKVMHALCIMIIDQVPETTEIH